MLRSLLFAISRCRIPGSGSLTPAAAASAGTAAAMSPVLAPRMADQDPMLGDLVGNPRADILGTSLGGTNRNESHDLNEDGWPRRCSEQCAPVTALARDKGYCDTNTARTARPNNDTLECAGLWKVPLADACRVSLTCSSTAPASRWALAHRAGEPQS